LQYNGCKWRGNKLRVELAKPHFATKLQQEWQEQQQQEQQQQEAAELAKQNGGLPPKAAAGVAGGAAAADGDGEDGEDHSRTIRITMPGKRKVGARQCLTAAAAIGRAPP
jgi:hypothetical protein